MKLLTKDFKKGNVKIEINTLDDLWFLSHIIDEGDHLKGKTLRKIKLGDETDRNLKVIKKLVTLEIAVEKLEFHKFSNSLRVSGKITDGPDDVPRASYHTLDLEEGKIITIKKEQWLNYQIEKLTEASQDKLEKILIIAFDRSTATYALLTQSGFKILSDVSGDVSKKGYEETKGKDFFSEVAKQIHDYHERHKIQYIILASPAFWKEDLMKIIKKNNPDLIKKITLATCNSTGGNGVEEILKRDEVKTVLKQDRTTKETEYVEELFKEISKQAKAAYGIKEVQEASEAHAIKSLLVTDELIHDLREKEKFHELDAIMKDVDRSNGEVHIISSENEAGKKIDGIGGIAAILRYKTK
mgnify:FL=1